MPSSDDSGTRILARRAPRDRRSGLDRRRPVPAPLAQALDGDDMHVWMLLDQAGRVLAASQDAQALLGRDAPAGLEARVFFTLEAATAFDALRAQSLAAKAARRAPLELAAQETGRRTAEITLMPVPSWRPGSKGAALALLARDMSDEHEETEKLRRGTLEVIRLNSELRRESTAKQIALQALEELSGRLKGVLEAASRVVIVATSLSGVITVFNPGAANLLGYSPSEMEGLETPLAFLDEEELAQAARTLFPGEARPPAGLGVLMALASDVGRGFGEWTLIRKDGGRFAAEVVFSAIRGSHGVEGYLLVAVDISARKLAEEARAEREARLRAILDGAADGIITVDDDGLIESVNRAAESLFGYASTELAGYPLDLVAPGALDLPGPARKVPAAREVMGLHKGGEPFPMEMTVSAVELPARRLRTLIVRDITARRKAEEAQRQFTRRLAEQQASMERDLKAAAEIQKSLLPKDLSPDPRCQAAWLFTPSATIGGDIFNILPLGPDRTCLYMLDVSGHGVPSALVAAAAAQALQFQSRTNGLGDAPPSDPAARDAGDAACPVSLEAPDPARVLTALDLEFPLERFDRYFSLFYAHLDLTRRSLSFSNAGHPPPLLLRASGEVESLDTGGTVIGLGGLLPFESRTVPLSSGDRLLLYTDGLTEFEGAKGRPFGTARLTKWLKASRDLPPDEAMDELGRELDRFAGKVKPQDDLTVLCLRFTFQESPEERPT